jgi:gas vesicle protein
MTRYQNGPKRKASTSQNRHSMSTDVMEIVGSGLGGLALGATLMYLFDPQTGQKRRERVSDAAHSAFDTTGQALSSLTSGASSAVSGAGEYLSDLTGRMDVRGTRDEYGGRIGSAYRGIRGAVGDYLGDLTDRAQSQYRGVSKSARRYSRSLPSMPSMRLTTRESDGFSGTATALSAFGALALGCAAMYFLDPRQGNARRTYLIQKAGKFVRETGQMARATGRHLANKSKGYYHEASNIVPDVGSKMGQIMGSSQQEAWSQRNAGAESMANEGPAYDLQANTPTSARPNPSAM